MTSSPRVSVMIPAYNGERYLREALNSIVSQEGADYEVVLIDDASTDTTPEIAGSFSRVRYVRNPCNLGLAANFNRCLELAQSPYLCVFGQDDLMEPGCLARVSEVLDQHTQVGMVFSNTRIVDAEGRVIRVWNGDMPGDSVFPGDSFLRRLILRDNPVCLSGAFFRLDLVRRLGGFNPGFRQTLDWHLWMRISLASDVAFLARPLTRYRTHPATATNMRNVFDNIHEVYLAKMDVLCGYASKIRSVRALEMRFRTRFGVGSAASAFRNLIRGRISLALSHFRLFWEIAPDLSWPAQVAMEAVARLCRLKAE